MHSYRFLPVLQQTCRAPAPLPTPCLALLGEMTLTSTLQQEGTMLPLSPVLPRESPLKAPRLLVARRHLEAPSRQLVAGRLLEATRQLEVRPLQLASLEQGTLYEAIMLMCHQGGTLLPSLILAPLHTMVHL